MHHLEKQNGSKEVELMGVLEIILIVACAAIVIGVITASIIKKKQGKCSCDCGGDCAHCAACMAAQKKKQSKNI